MAGKDVFCSLHLFKFLLRFVLVPIICSVMESVLMYLKRKCILLLLDWNILYISVRSIWTNVWFKSNVSLLMCCLDESEVLKSPTITVSSISPRSVTYDCFEFIFLMNCPLYYYILAFFVSYYQFWVKVCLSIFTSPSMECLVPFLHLEPMDVLKAEVSLL